MKADCSAFVKPALVSIAHSSYRSVLLETGNLAFFSLYTTAKITTIVCIILQKRSIMYCRNKLFIYIYILSIVDLTLQVVSHVHVALKLNVSLSCAWSADLLHTLVIHTIEMLKQSDFKKQFVSIGQYPVQVDTNDSNTNLTIFCVVLKIVPSFTSIDNVYSCINWKFNILFSSFKNS